MTRKELSSHDFIWFSRKTILFIGQPTISFYISTSQDVRQLAITWANVDSYWCCYMASLSRSRLIYKNCYENVAINLSTLWNRSTRRVKYYHPVFICRFQIHPNLVAVIRLISSLLVSAFGMQSGSVITWYNMTNVQITAATEAEYKSVSNKRHPISRPNGLWGVFWENSGENWPRYNGTAL